MSSTGLSRAISGSTTDHRCVSVAIEAMEGAAGVCEGEGPSIDIDGKFGTSWNHGYNDTQPETKERERLTGSLNMTGKSNRGKSMYKNRFYDFSVSACINQIGSIDVSFRVGCESELTA